MTRSRRTVLAALGAAVGGVAGCLARRGGGTTKPTDRSPPTDRPSSTEAGVEPTAGSTTRAVSSTPAETRVRLTATEGAPSEGSVAVYPPKLREWLRTAAASDSPIRGHDEAFVYTPEPVLERFERVELAGSDTSGVYELTVDGGTRYDLVVGAEAVDDPDGQVTPITSLTDDRRTLVERAIDDGERATVVPESPLGEWVRTAFFGGYVSHEGQVYRGYEVEQTDAAFFSTEVWYVLSLSAGTADAQSEGPATLDLTPLPDWFGTLVESELGEQEGQIREVLSEPTRLSADAVRVVEETEYLLTHTALFTVGVVR